MINIILYRPEKPLNTGNIIRTAMATDCKLHIIGPITFSLEEKDIKRAGLDYISVANFKYYENLEVFLETNSLDKSKIIYITRYGKKSYDNIEKKYNEDIFLMFGRESSGIPKEILSNNIDNCFRIPMVKEARSLNLANSVAIVVYDVLRKEDFNNLSKEEVLKGSNFLKN